jgi:hypothetical protein
MTPYDGFFFVISQSLQCTNQLMFSSSGTGGGNEPFQISQFILLLLSIRSPRALALSPYSFQTVKTLKCVDRSTDRVVGSVVQASQQ